MSALYEDDSTCLAPSGGEQHLRDTVTAPHKLTAAPVTHQHHKTLMVLYRARVNTSFFTPPRASPSRAHRVPILVLLPSLNGRHRLLVPSPAKPSVPSRSCS
ncbi:hypothetical protein E2C01_095626 [Portunus trituberculatus]|uniref:Uncharacterized protein n=1 Tax=Portunus trituberculatus TaxID=210409 RepID=A0A5B7JZC1_PORTR|nr:hypothetical protein [Portunus trituberculatus]